MLIENTLLGTVNKEEIAMQRLRSFEPEDGYYVAFGGGKDSIVVLDLVKRSGVKYDAHYTITSVDPPELVRYIRKYHPDVSMDYPRDKDGKVVTMWNLIPKHTIPPTRQARYCCASIKEVNGKGRVTVTGVRWDESIRRKKLHGVANVKTESKKIIQDALTTNPSAKLNDRGNLIMNDDNDESRRIVENCYRTRKVMVNPIVDWTDEEVWEYIHKHNLPYCELYDQGYTRIGCIGCPLAGAKQMKRDFERYPKYRDNYIRAFDRMIKAHPGEIRIATGEPAETGGAYSERGTSGAVVHEESELSRVEIDANGGAETSSGGRGFSERTGEERNGYAERNAALVQTAQRGCKYKMIQNGMDEYKRWIEEAIEHGEPAEPVTLKRGAERLGRKQFILPQNRSLDFGSSNS